MSLEIIIILITQMTILMAGTNVHPKYLDYDHRIVDDFRSGKLDRYPRIINGEYVKRDNFSYVIQLESLDRNPVQEYFFGRGRRQICSGSILSARWILTAAHCMDKLGDFLYSHIHVRIIRDPFDASLKKHSYDKWLRSKIFGANEEATSFHIEKYFVHPQYERNALENDIALIKLKDVIPLGSESQTSTVKLPPANAGLWPLSDQICYVSGYGCEKPEGSIAKKLKTLEAPIINPFQCQRMYGLNFLINLTIAKEFCAGFRSQNKSICQGDSGGPIVCEFNSEKYIAGVTSANHRNDPSNYPGIFSRVTYFVPWIRHILSTE